MLEEVSKYVIKAHAKVRPDCHAYWETIDLIDGDDKDAMLQVYKNIIEKYNEFNNLNTNKDVWDFASYLTSQFGHSIEFIIELPRIYELIDLSEEFK